MTKQQAIEILKATRSTVDNISDLGMACSIAIETLERTVPANCNMFKFDLEQWVSVTYDNYITLVKKDNPEVTVTVERRYPSPLQDI